jgi:hypothetical protein
MCDTAGAINGYYTPKDMQNARIYARLKMIYERVSKYPNLKWIDTNVDGSPNYNCPPGLTCKDGYVEIANEEECNRMSNENIDVDVEENADNHYYLEWRSKIGPNSGKGQCYRGNMRFRKMCEKGDFVDDGKTSPVDGLYYDTYSGRCFITPTYCRNVGELKYDSPSDTDVNIPSYLKNKLDKNGNPYSIGGVCDMNDGQKVADFIFGETVARGVFGGKCFK